jgi:hypothetical protein
METPEMVIDARGDVFHMGGIEAEVNGRKNYIILEARQVELLLKLILIVPYEKKTTNNR